MSAGVLRCYIACLGMLNVCFMPPRLPGQPTLPASFLMLAPLSGLLASFPLPSYLPSVLACFPPFQLVSLFQKWFAIYLFPFSLHLLVQPVKVSRANAGCTSVRVLIVLLK
jgi:hypothetical protein